MGALAVSIVFSDRRVPMGLTSSSGMITTDLLVIGGGVNGAVSPEMQPDAVCACFCARRMIWLSTPPPPAPSLSTAACATWSIMISPGSPCAAGTRTAVARGAAHHLADAFVLPHHKALQAAMGDPHRAFLYDHIGGRNCCLRRTESTCANTRFGALLKPAFKTGFEYSDCWVQDARLVVLNAMDAGRLGAEIRTRTRCVGIKRHDSRWLADLRDERSGHLYSRGAGAGQCSRPMGGTGCDWILTVTSEQESGWSGEAISLCPGCSTTAIPISSRMLMGGCCSPFPSNGISRCSAPRNRRRRGARAGADYCTGDRLYICSAVNEYLNKPVTPVDVVWSYSGVRPLVR